MPLLINLHHLETEDATLQGEIPVSELEIADVDECIEALWPLKYNLTAELMEDAVFVRGQVSLDLQCTCVRCLKVFTRRLDLRDWIAHVARVGEGSVPIVNDMVDLTPLLREDILLEFPQYPLCEAGCQGLSEKLKDDARQAGGAKQKPVVSSAWAELNKLKL